MQMGRGHADNNTIVWFVKIWDIFTAYLRLINSQARPADFIGIFRSQDLVDYSNSQEDSSKGPKALCKAVIAL